MSLILLESGTNKNATKNSEITQPSHYCISGTLCHRIEVELKNCIFSSLIKESCEVYRLRGFVIQMLYIRQTIARFVQFSSSGRSAYFGYRAKEPINN